MKKTLLLLLTIFTISCSQNKINDISDSELNNITDKGDILYSLVLSEEHKNGEYWNNQVRDAKSLNKSIESLLERIDKDQLIDESFINELDYNIDLWIFLPKEFNSLPKNYKKLIIKNYEQRVLNDLEFDCLYQSFHYFAVAANVKEAKDTIKFGDEYTAEISILASNFRDTIFLYDENDSLIFTGVDSMGYVNFRRKESSRGLKVYKGYYKGSLLKNSKSPGIRIEYYVE